jgi:hypothetical protein
MIVTGRNAVTYTALPTFVSCAMSGFLGRSNWRDHCRNHFDDLSTFPTSFDPLLHGGVLASPGYCPFYLVNETLEPHDRIRQFLHRTKWLEHLQRHIEGLRKSERENKLMSVECPCPRPQCPKSFDCVLELEFHLQDIHGPDMPKQSKHERDQECRVKRSNKL